jgi:nucleoside 2-deoxyribosyltransferase
MRNPKVPHIATDLRCEGLEVFDDWYSPGKEADDEWQVYEKLRGRTFKEALDGAHAWNTFNFDLRHLRTASSVVMVTPAGKSAHIELGYMIGSGKPAFIYMEGEPERFDIMYRFANAVCTDFAELVKELKYYEHR